MEEGDNEEPQTPAESAGGLENAERIDPVDGLAHPPPGSIPVVGLGGSAGSLAALRTFVSNIPQDSRAAYVVVVHLSPEHESMLPEILQRETKLPVIRVEDSVPIESDQIYVISPGRQLSIFDGKLESVDLKRPKGGPVTIDVFFRTLAEAHGANASAIVLSGADGDGALGLKRVKERGGLTVVQDPAEAEFDAMPRASIATGMVDWILPAEEMPGRLIEYWSNGRKLRLPSCAPMETGEEEEIFPPESDEKYLREILGYLNARSGHDFAGYKRATILRRVGRRMQVNGAQTLAEYLEFLRTHPGESGALLQDLLISVTNFFRDGDAFRALEEAIPSLFKDKSGSDEIRVWVPGCATGEEAYSIAILLSEYAGKLTHPPAIQIFATDLDQGAIAAAREGMYPVAIEADISERRLQRFFTREDEGGYRVKKVIRDMILFAVHDLLRDPPFSRLDLASCRNLLIYLNRAAQAKVFDILHFALLPQGKLFLGSSESIEDGPGLFDPVDKKHRLFVRKDSKRVGLPIPATVGSHSFTHGGLGVPRMIPTGGGDEGVHPSPPPLAVAPVDLHLRLIERLAAPSILVNREHDIVHLSKNAGKYLRLDGGVPSTDVLKLIQPELRIPLRALLLKAPKANAAVKSSNLEFSAGSGSGFVTISVEPMEFASRVFFLVLFQEQESAPAKRAKASEVSEGEESMVRHLEEELERVRTTWRDSVEQYESSAEELKASNEELQAMNEELRSATEELETGREELQSINEEVITINQELKRKVEELSRANSDLQNLMASTKIATIFLDRDLRIKRYTPATSELFNLIPSDEGRPLSDLTNNLEYPGIRKDASGVLTDLGQVEREVRDTEGKWFLVRISPYRTTEDQIAGVVITCIDITERKRNEDSLRWLSAIVESSTDAVISFKLDGEIVSWNKGAERIFGYSADEILGKSCSLLAPEPLGEERQDLLRRLREGEAIDPFETVRIRKDGKEIDISLSASVMRDESGEIVGATAIARDVSVRKKALKDLSNARDELEHRVKERTAELRTRVSELAHMASEVTFAEDRERKRMARILHDGLQQLLVSAKMGIQALAGLDDEERKRETGNLTKLMDDLIASSRSLSIDLSPPVLSETLGCALDWLCHTWVPGKHNLHVQTDIDLTLDAMSEDIRSIVFYSVRELLFNVVKHSKVMEAHVTLAPHGEGDLKVTVRDHGLGFDTAAKAVKDGKATGFGLIGLRERLEMLGGKFTIRSQPDEGVEAVIIVPRKTNDHK